MNRIFNFFLLCLIASVSVVCYGQTYAYRKVKLIMNTGEVINLNSSTKIYVTFSSGKSSFYISKSDGSRAGWPDATTGYASGYNNSNTPANYTGFCNQVMNPQDFKYTNDSGNIHIYKNTRPIYQRVINQGDSFTEYVYDYAKFNADYSRINVIIAPEKGSNGIYPFGIQGLSTDVQQYKAIVFERVKQANANNQDFY